jgi:uncharacterized membrane protein
MKYKSNHNEKSPSMAFWFLTLRIWSTIDFLKFDFYILWLHLLNTVLFFVSVDPIRTKSICVPQISKHLLLCFVFLVKITRNNFSVTWNAGCCGVVWPEHQMTRKCLQAAVTYYKQAITLKTNISRMTGDAHILVHTTQLYLLETRVWKQMGGVKENDGGC